MRLLLATALVCSLPLSAAPVKKKVPLKKSASASHSKTARPSSRSTSSRSTSSRSTARTRAVAVRKPSTQAAPSSDRYEEIQDALVAKGYLKTPATGVWDQDSQEAMRRFQADEKLDVTGKLSARTLISLGLGPKQ